MKIEYLNEIRWPKRPDLISLGEAIGRARDLDVVVTEIPEDLRDPKISGLTVVDGSTAYVFYDPDLSALNRVQTVLHEYAHILNYDVCPGSSGSHARTTLDREIERCAELMAMELMKELRRRSRVGTDILDFLAGRPRRGT